MSSALQLPKERVQALDPATVESYLAANGWLLDAGVSSAEVGVYHLPSDAQAEIVVPRDKNLVDYALRIGEALRDVAATERRKAWEVLEELSLQQAAAPRNGPAPENRGRGNGAAVRRNEKDAS
jgi:hypothetical protein